MKTTVSAAKAQLTDLVRRAEQGEEVFLTRHGVDVVQLVPLRKARAKNLIAEIEAIQRNVAKKITPGPSAARAADFLYDDEYGLPK